MARKNRAISFRFRLALLVSALSVFSIFVLFVVTFFSLYRTLQTEDLNEMRSRLLSYWAIDQTGGLSLLRGEIELDSLVAGERPFVARIATNSNDTQSLTYPESWSSFNFDRLSLYDLEPDQIVALGSPDHDFSLEFAAIELSDGNFLQIGFSNANRIRLLALFRRNFTVIAVAVLAVGLALGLIAARRALAPVAEISRAAQEIVDTGNLEARIPVPRGGGELHNLTVLFNAMIGRIERLVANIQRTVDDVAHDLRTPVTRLTSTVELALRGGNHQEALEEVQLQSEHILKIVNTLLEITRAESGVLGLDQVPVGVAAALEEVRDLYDLVAEDRGVALTVYVDGALSVEGDPVRFRQAVANLVDNAIKYNRRGGTVDISARRVEDDVVVEVKDSGPGLAPGEVPRVWDRMYRAPAQPAETGLGLGLSIVKALSEAQGGRVEVASSPGVGSTFSIVMRASEP